MNNILQWMLEEMGGEVFALMGGEVLCFNGVKYCELMGEVLCFNVW
jgi:hypothetical protein